MRFVKAGVARALRTLRAATSPEPGDRVVPLSAQMVGLRSQPPLKPLASKSRVTATRDGLGWRQPGCVHHDVMLAGNWKNLADGGPVLCWGDCGTQCRWRGIYEGPRTGASFECVLAACLAELHAASSASHGILTVRSPAPARPARRRLYREFAF